jgi:SAM-dependent methyltransferase
MIPHEVKAGFEQWSVFEKVKKANRMHHEEVYGVLSNVLAEWKASPPRFLDVGCGDANDISRILGVLPPSGYIGIDNSPQALERACAHLGQRLSCTWQLVCADYAEALKSLHTSFDVIWLGLFLHHLSLEQKRTFFQRASALLAPGGVVICHDPVLLETEDRAGFLERISLASRDWQEISPDEREVFCRHMSHHGQQERIGLLQDVARESGFSRTRILWRDPDWFYALMAFWP